MGVLSHCCCVGKFYPRFLIGDEIRIFSEEEGNGLAHKFNNNNLFMKLAFLSDKFQKLNELYLK